MRESNKDIVLSIGLIAIGAVALVIIMTTTAERRISGAEVMTFATMPAIYSGFLIALSALSLFGAIRRSRATVRRELAEPAILSTDQPAAGPSRRMIALRTVATLVALLAYTLLLEFVHFWILTTAFLALMFVLFGQRSPLRVGLVSVCGGTAFYALFILALGLPV